MSGAPSVSTNQIWLSSGIVVFIPARTPKKMEAPSTRSVRAANHFGSSTLIRDRRTKGESIFAEVDTMRLCALGAEMDISTQMMAANGAAASKGKGGASPRGGGHKVIGLRGLSNCVKVEASAIQSRPDV